MAITFLEEEPAAPTKRKVTFLEEEAPARLFAEEAEVEQPQQTTLGERLETTAAGLEAGIGRAGLAFAKGTVGGVRAFSDVLGANNPISKKLAGVEDYLDSLMSAQSRNNQEEIGRLFDEAESKGLKDKVVAGLEAFTVAPEETLAQAGGYMLPNIAAGVLGKAAQLGKLGITAVQVGTGATQAAGTVKGEIYRGVTDYLREQGTPEDQIEKIATEAQAYGGQNLDQILLGAGLGGLAASTGAERIITRMLTKTGKEVSKKGIGEILKGGIKGGAAEAVTEFPQEAQEQVAQNLALQRIGAEVPTFKGAVQAGAMGAAAGLVLGGGAGAVEVLTAEEKAEQDINRDAEKEARNLSIPAGDTNAKTVVNEINRTENDINALREVYDEMDPATPEAQELAKDIANAQKRLAGLKQQIGEPLAQAEARQAELATAIAEEPLSSTITEPSIVSEQGALVSETTPAAPSPLKADAPLDQRKKRAKTMWDAAKVGDVYEAEGGMEGEKFTITIKANKDGTRYAEITSEEGSYVDTVSLDRKGSDPTKGVGLIYGADMVLKPKPDSTPAAPTISEKQQTSPMIGAEPTQPSPAEGVTPAGPIGNRIKLGRSPQTYVVEETIPQTEREMELGEQFFRVRNERTGETQVVEQADMKPVQPREEKRFNPLGYDIVDVVEDINAGNTATPLRAVNQVIKESTDLRNRIKAASERRQQPRKRGKAAILERIARDRSAGTLTEQTARALTDFVNRIRDDAIGDVAISIRQKGVSNYDFADNLVSFFLNQDKKDLGTAVGIHEFWHGLSRYLPEAEVQQMNDQYLKELEAYIKKNPWFLAFVGRYSLTPEQFEAYKQFNPKEAETKLEPVRDEQGNIVKYKIKFDKDNYRYIMLDEFIAEKMTDLVIGKQAVPDTFLGKLAKVFREFLDLIKARLGRNPYEKFYQLVTSTEDKLILQRTSGVAEPFQIYDPQTYDYSTQRRMAVDPREEGPVQESPEGQSVAKAMSKGIDIGPENNMPPDQKIDSHLKNFLYIRGVFESASDRLRRNGFVKLGNAVDSYLDQARERLGIANRYMLKPLQEFAASKDKKRIDEDVQKFFAAQENKRDTGPIRVEMHPIAIKIVDAWQKFGEYSGKDNQRIGIKVFEVLKGLWRPIGQIPKFWPRQLKPEYQRALINPEKYAKEYNEIVEALLENGNIKTPEEAKKYLRDYKPDAYKNDYFSGIEMARGLALPESLYDYSIPVMTNYIARWAQHASRIEAFGQKTTPESKTMWDREIDATRDQKTIDYIDAVRQRIEGFFPNDPYLRGAAALNIWATGLQLGNPASATLNWLGGSALNAMIGQPGALKSFVESLIELRNLGARIQDAKEVGILSQDLMNIVGDHQTVLESNGIALAGQKTADFLLKWSGFTAAEQMVRTQSYIIGKSFLRSALKANLNNPKGAYARRARAWLTRNNFDLDKLIVENGDGPETNRLLRYFANISQGSYTVDQVPAYIDMPVGKFLFKYQKFSTQVMRMAWKNTFEPAWKAVTGRDEMVQLPNQARQILYRLKLAEAKEIGDTRPITLDSIPKKVGKAEARALTIIPVMMWLGSAYVGGEILLRLRDMLFGVLMKGPEYEDMLKELEDDDTAAAVYLGLERAWYNLIGIGALGFIGNYAQFFLDWSDRERVKNPLDPPALGVATEVGNLITTAVDQGKLTAGDLSNFATKQVSAYRTTKRLTQSTANALGLEDFPGLKEEMFRREVASINKYARRWAEEAGVEYRMRRPGDVAATERTPINRKIAGFLQSGEPEKAAVFAREYLDSLPKDERKNAIQSITTGARNRQPLRLGSGPMDEAERRAFLRWLKENVSEEKYEKILEMDREYQRDYRRFLGRVPNR